MDTETLSQILQMVGQAGEGAYSLAVIYLFIPYFKAIVGIGMMWLVVKTVYSIINSLTFVNAAAAAAGYEVYGEADSLDRQNIIKIILRGKQALKNENK